MVDVVETLHGWIEQWMNQRGGGDNWDWDHSNNVFSQYFGSYGANIVTRMTPYNIVTQDIQKISAYDTTYGPNGFDSTFHFQHTYQSSDSFQWTLSDSLKTTISDKVGVSVPDLFTAEVGTSFEISTSVTNSQTQTNTTTWSQSADIPVPANQTAHVTMVVQQTVATANSTLTAVVTGSIAAGLNNRWNDHYFWFIPVTDLAQEFNTSAGITVVGNTVVFSIPVNFEGQGAISSQIQITRTDQQNNVLGTTSQNFLQHPSAALAGASPAS